MHWLEDAKCPGIRFKYYIKKIGFFLIFTTLLDPTKVGFNLIRDYFT